jgi:hypothetical protein
LAKLHGHQGVLTIPLHFCEKISGHVLYLGLAIGDLTNLDELFSNQNIYAITTNCLVRRGDKWENYGATPIKTDSKVLIQFDFCRNEVSFIIDGQNQGVAFDRPFNLVNDPISLFVTLKYKNQMIKLLTDDIVYTDTLKERELLKLREIDYKFELDEL